MNDPYMDRLREFYKKNSFAPDEATHLSQQICLKLFEELSKICDSNDIRYWATGGTLIGAVRHSGFVPWDDDMDLMMSRADIDKLKKSIDGSEYRLVKGYYGMFKFKPLIGAGFIDIFPYDMISYSSDKYELRRIYSDLFTMKSSIFDKNSLKRGREEKHRIHDYLSTIPRILSGGYCYYSIGVDVIIHRGRKLAGIPPDKIFPLRRMKFSNTSMYVPNDPDYLLSLQYSEYRMPVVYATHGSNVSELMKTCKKMNIDLGVTSRPKDLDLSYKALIHKLVKLLVKEEDYRAHLDISLVYRKGLGCDVDLDKALFFAKTAYETEVNDHTIISYYDLLKTKNDWKTCQEVLPSYSSNPEILFRKIDYAQRFNLMETEGIIDSYKKIIKFNREWEFNMIDFEMKTGIEDYILDAYERSLFLSKIGWKKAQLFLVELCMDKNSICNNSDLGEIWINRLLRNDVSYANRVYEILCRVGALEALNSMVEIIVPFAESGDSGAQRCIGQAYRDGKGAPQDLDKAAEWMRKAADKNLGRAKNELFDILWRIGTPESYREMISVATEFAESGDGAAMGRIGRAYRDGKGVEKNLDEAIRWMYEASCEDLNWARNELFDLFCKRGEPDDFIKAKAIVEISAKNGDMGGMGRLGRAYRDGKGVEKDLDKAIEWIRKAVPRNDIWKNELIELLRKRGLPEDIKELEDLSNKPK